ncbi:c-type cytochrome [Mucilaginibacter sp.]|uniref:c-type cytochrome n=1 Tax=Mucilaginibacter sp. TaxID=1882438 RepID=UPI0026100D8B|nr:c-type cytochrome [Mucilaginibacter sp.]MDB4927089.1 hypothetical protein [Mucilaginibacter sp.]
MRFNPKLLIPVCLLSGAMLLASMTLIQQAPKEENEKAVNLKVLPKNISHKDLDRIMGQWASSLGVKCGFCHARNEETKKTDFPSDAKPEKLMARKMYLMAAKLNKKYFKAEKDSLNMMKLSSVNCYTCHRGVAHLEAATWPKRGGGPGPGPGGPGVQSGPGAGGAPSPDKKP